MTPYEAERVLAALEQLAKAQGLRNYGDTAAIECEQEARSILAGLLQDQPGSMAQARLSAAAPEMLEALQGLMPVLNRVMHLSGGTWDLDDEKAVQYAKQVLDKATQ